MKYITLLRGINVGGNGTIKMADLKQAIERCGFQDVKTFIQSGNVVFKTGEQDTGKIEVKLEDCLRTQLKIDTRAIVRTDKQLQKAVAELPDNWKGRPDLLCYLAFFRKPLTAQDIIRNIDLKEGADFAEAGEGVVYMATLLGGFTKSGFARLNSKKISDDITIRSCSTVRKLLLL